MARHAAERAASLTARLLAFSRKQALRPTPTDLNGLVRDMTELLHRSLGEEVELEAVLSPRLWTAEVDQSQLESAIERDPEPGGQRYQVLETGDADAALAILEGDQRVDLLFTDVALLPKPFTFEQLATLVRDVLDA